MRAASTAVLILVLLLLTARQAAGHSYYVAPGGDDSGPGSADEPYRTIVHGAGVLAAGDTLLVRAGTYAEEIYDGIQGGDSWDSPTVIRAYGDDRIVIQPLPGALRAFTFFTRKAHYIEVAGFIIDAASVQDDAIKITYYGPGDNAHHIRFRDCEVMHSPNQGILVTGDPAYGGLDVQGNEFIHLAVHDNGTDDYDHGFYVTTANNLVEKCDVYRSTGQGIGFYDALGPTANDNIARDNRIFDNNLVGPRGFGLGFFTGARGIAYNNLIWGNRIGIDLDYNVRDTKIYNNVVFGNSSYGLYIGGFCQHATIINNIVWRNAASLYDLGVSTTFEANLFDVDPDFVDEDAHDFHLLPISVAIDGGVTLAEVSADFDGISRPQGAAYDIGAYEYRDPAWISEDAAAGGAKSIRIVPAPNPFTETVAFLIPGGTRGMSLEIYDGTGRRLRSLVGAGPNLWDGRDEWGHRVAPGVYFVRSRTPYGSTISRVVRAR